ncbi:Uncharacterised protein [Vibrio cholerae]|nr:Uncharacterised protein [Vibrio cholerae]
MPCAHLIGSPDYLIKKGLSLLWQAPLRYNAFSSTVKKHHVPSRCVYCPNRPSSVPSPLLAQPIFLNRRTRVQLTFHHLVRLGYNVGSWLRLAAQIQAKQIS